MFSRFRKDLKKYYKYSIYAAKSELKSEIANSYLNWIWWILEPLCFMQIYAFVFGKIFNGREDNFHLFIFIGITMWDFFSKTLTQSVRIVKRNKSIVSKVYMPKFILVLVQMFVNGFKMIMSFGIVIVMMFFTNPKVEITYNIIYIIPILIDLFFITFGLSNILLHFGVYIDDLVNVVPIVLRILFYMTGIFFDIKQRLKKYKPFNHIIANYNPMAFLLISARQCLLYHSTPSRHLLLLWFVLGIVFSIIGIYTVYKHENSYVKVI